MDNINDNPPYNHIICVYCRTLQDLSHYTKYKRSNKYHYSESCNECRIKNSRKIHPLLKSFKHIDYWYKCDICNHHVRVSDDLSYDRTVNLHINTITHKKKLKLKNKNKYKYYNKEKMYYPLKN